MTPRANGRCSGVVYDPVFAQFPQTTLAYQAGCASAAPLQTTAMYDRGLERVTMQTAPFSGVVPRVTLTKYDPFGRVSEIDQPMATFAGMADTLHPALKVVYNDTGPVRQIFSSTSDGSGANLTYQQHVRYVDGLGETLLVRDGAEAPVDLSNWILSGVHTRFPNGLVSSSYQPFFQTQLDPLFYINNLPPYHFSQTTYDGLGRVVAKTDFNDHQTNYTHHFGTGIIPVSGITNAIASVTVQDPEQTSGQHLGSFTTSYLDGHGRTTQTQQRLIATSADGSVAQDILTTTSFLASGEATTISQTFPQNLTVSSFARQMTYDALGRMVSQTEPNVGTWSYVYNDSGDLVGSSDARGCGKVVYHDGLGRVTAEDYSPCDSSQPAYTVPNPATGDGTEAFYVYNGYGQPARVCDVAQHSDYTYDGRGRVTRMRRQLATPGGSPFLATRYAPHVFTKGFLSYSEANRLLVSTTGTDLADFAVHGLSKVTTAYSTEGTLKSIDSSYGLLLSQATDASKRVTSRAYGDGAGTSAKLGYDDNGALSGYVLQRNPGSGVNGAWTTFQSVTSPPPDQTTQTVLASIGVGRDLVGNPTSMTQSTSASSVGIVGGQMPLPPVNPVEWPGGAAPILTRQMSYGDDYRLQELQTQYSGVEDIATSPYTSTDGSLYPTPAPVTGGHRVRDQTYKYDLRGNVAQSTDNANVFFDRSIAGVSYAQDRLTAAGVASGYGSLSTSHDAAGNLQSTSITGGATYAYAWDELGRLATATRTDPGGTSVQQHYAYDAQGQRVRMTTQNSSTSTTLHTLQVFDSLVLKGATFPDASGDYEHDDSTEHLYLGAAGVAAAHVFYAQSPIPSANGPLHTFLPLHDPLGSTAFVIDRDTGELVEAATYQAYGAVESDYRPARWNSFREDVRYTGHWDNSEVGLVYMNARYYSPQLMRFISPDPRTIHGVAGDLNPYAYGRGSPLRFVDTLGLYGCDKSVASCPDTSAPYTPSDGASHASDPQPSQPIASQTDYNNGPSVGPANQHFDYSLGFDPTVQTVDTRPADERFVGTVGAMAALADPEVALEEASATEGLSVTAADIEGLQSAVRPYEVGTFNDLQARSAVGDALDLHHVGQAHALEQLIPGYDRATAPSIALPEAEHALIPNLRGTVELTPRQVLAQDILNLRQYTNAPNSSLINLIELNQSLYPEAFAP